MKKFNALLKNNAHKMLALIMAVVLTVSGVTIYSSAHTSTGGFPASETGKYATVKFSDEISTGSKWSDDLNKLFGCHSVQEITLTSKVNKKDVNREAFCIAPGTPIIPNSTYVSSEISSKRVKPYFKAAINYYYNTASIGKDERRMVTQLFIWQIHTRNKEVPKDEELTKVKLTESAFETLVIKILREKYGLSKNNAEAVYNEAKNYIFVNGENNDYKNDIGAVKWDTTNASGQTLLTGEDLPQDVKVKISITKKIKKVDGTELTNGNKTGCVFRVYKNRECTKREKDKDGKYVDITIPSTGNGVSTYMQYKFDELPDYLYVKEYSASAGSSLNSNVYRIGLKDLKDGDVKEINVSVDNSAWYGKARIRKIDAETKKPLAGAKYKLQEWDATSQTFKDISGSIGGPYVTSASQNTLGYTPYTPELYYTTSNLGRFRFVETEAPTNYNLNGSVREFTINKTNQSLTLENSNFAVRNGEIIVNKVDSITGELLSGALFEVRMGVNPYTEYDGSIHYAEYKSLGYMMESKEKKGSYSMSKLPANTDYRVIEVQGPAYHWAAGIAQGGGASQAANWWTTVTLSGTNTNEELTVENKPIMGKIVISKTDSETGKPLADATFELWRTDSTGKIPEQGNTESTEGNGKEEVLPDEITTQTAELVGVYTTDSNGKFEVRNIFQGSYYVLREISAPNGYKYDTEKNTYFIDDLASIKAVSNSAGPNVDFVKEIAITNEPIKIPVEVYKTSSSSKRETLIPLEGATFSIYDATQIPEEEWMNFDTSKYTPVATMTTDANGKALSEALHLGKYVMVETGVPKNMLPCENHVFDLEVSTGEVYYHEAVDPEFEANVKIIKKDKKTGNVIKLKDTAFKIKNTSTGEFITQSVMVADEENPDIAESTYETDTFYTDEEGAAKLPEKLPVGSYEIVEVKSPYGYALNETGVKFSVSTDEPYEWDGDTHSPLIVAEFYDDATVGKLILEKKGETLKAIENGKFIYEEMPLKNADFALEVAEDIYAPDGSGTLVYEKGTLIDSKTTNEEGQIIFDNLPLGKYVFYETKCPEGYVLDDTRYEIEIEYVENAKLVEVSQKVLNTRQQVKIRVIKKDKEKDITLKGAVFGIYANENILDKDGNIVIKAGDLLEEKTTGEDGTATFGEDMDYPVSTYLLKELVPPSGYATNKDEFLIEGLVAPQTSPTIEKEYVVYDEITQIEVSKKDITTGEEVDGATLKVWYTDASGNEVTVDEWISGQTKHMIKGLEVGREYTLSETIVADGYVTANDVKFTVLDTGEVQPVEMVDDITKVEITKSDITTGSPVIGATLTITDANGNVWAEWITTDKPYYIEKLPIGTYTLKEILPPGDDGYVTAQDIQFTVEDTGEIQKVDMKDDYTKVSISKKSLITGQFVIGATLQILDENKNVVEEWVTDETVKQFIRLPFGKYTLVEKEAPAGYLIAEPIEFEVTDSPEELRLTMYDDEIRLKIALTKTETGNEDKVLEGAEYSVYDENDKLVTVLKTNKDGYAESNALEVKNYYVKETKAPKGYYVSNNTYKVNANLEELDDTEYYVDEDDRVLYDIGTVTDKKIPPSKTPKTGDMGTKALYILLGGLFLAAAGLCGYGALKLSNED